MRTAEAIYDPAEHESLLDVAWSASTALDGAREIALDALDAARGSLWPMHPDDSGPRDEFDEATCLYFGAAGVALALDWLHRELDTPAPATITGLLDRMRDTHATNPPFEPSPASWLLGRSGFDAAMTVLAGDPIDRVLVDARIAIVNTVHDPLCAGGNALAGLLALDARIAGDDRLVELFRHGVREELDALQAGPAGCEQWLVDLYGNEQWMVGAGHGAAGILQPMLQGAHHLDDATNERVLRVARELVAATVLRDGDLVNWPASLEQDSGRIPVQWCHGAPGIILALAEAARGDDATTALLVAGGELTWTAGPMVKGPTICHGTAGNALALLQLFDLTGDERWLDRARRMAMHALTQVRRRRAEVGHGRYSLMTGDLGVAYCLVECDRARARGLLGLDLL